ncbi:MAG: hypothetical protein FIB07_15480 [Candidatus Methanoperedens sp.]|nr:hypothetical protein [Candidatus Methanoperedens sp.]
MMVACGFREAVTDFTSFFSDRLFSITYFGAAHRKGRKAQQFRTRMTRIARIFTDNFNPCASVLSVKSVFHHVCPSLKNPPSGASTSAFISVHLRFFIDVIFQTGLTGFTGYAFNPVNPVILSDLMNSLVARQQIAKLPEGVGR